MADPDAVRARRRRAHLRGDHSMCRVDRCGDKAKIAVISGGDQPGTSQTSSRLVESYREALAEVGREHTPEGQVVLRLAEALGRMNDNASGIASLARELRAAYDRATEGATGKADAADELAARRAAKLGGA